MEKELVELLSEREADGDIYWHIFDREGKTIQPAFDYLIESVQRQLKPQSVENRAYALKAWYRYLAKNAVRDVEAGDEVLVEFRDDTFRRPAQNSGADDQARKRSINTTLRYIYQYYVWLQGQPAYRGGRKLIGERNAQITSTLLFGDGSSRSRSRSDYPATYRNVGEGSRHRVSYVPTERDRALIHAYFHAYRSPDIALRDTLLYDLVWEVGWRRGSILSLNTTDFERARSDASSDTISVRPRVQKFGYSKWFEVPMYLAHRIVDYIDTERAAIIKATGSRAQEVFLSSTTGRPLSAKGVTTNFSLASNAVGLPPRSGLHGGRRGFTNNFLEREIAARLQLGQDTSTEALSFSLAQALGHESVDSQAAYIDHARSIVREAPAFRCAVANARLANENAILRAAKSRVGI